MFLCFLPFSYIPEYLNFFWSSFLPLPRKKFSLVTSILGDPGAGALIFLSYFWSSIFFPAHFDFVFGPTICPWVSENGLLEAQTGGFGGLWLGNPVTKLETFVWILNHVCVVHNLFAIQLKSTACESRRHVRLLCG